MPIARGVGTLLGGPGPTTITASRGWVPCGRVTVSRGARAREEEVGVRPATRVDGGEV